jgi:PTS system mannose-specific IIA component
MRGSMKDGSAVTGIILVTHGMWGQALREAAEVFLGPQARVCFVPLDLDDSPEGLTEKLETALTQLGEGTPVLFLVDLRGGTPWNTVAVLTRRKKLQCVSGLNLPMLLEVLVKRDEVPPEALADVATAAGRDGVVNLIELLRQAANTKKASNPEQEEKQA